jgi:hypothetical protein
MLILDGPSFFRFPTLLRMMRYVNNDGYVAFEYCRKEVRIIKNLGIPTYLEKGRAMDKPIRVMGKKKNGIKKYSVRAITIMKLSDMKNKIYKIIGDD